MTLDLPGGRRLLLAGGGWGVYWLIAGVVAAALLIWLYREERRLVPRRVGLGLLALRLAAAGALVTALFEPIAETTVRETVRGRVLLAVDVSESMGTADPGRTADERARLTATLGLSPGDPIDTLTRREVARRLIDGPRAPLARLATDHAVEVWAFARDAAPASLDALAATLQAPAPEGDPAATATDWLPALGEALKGNDPAAPVVGVALLTDGRRNAGDDPGPVIDRLAARGVPVFPVLIGSTRPPRDAAVAALKAPESVYQGDTATVQAVLKLDGYAGLDVAVTLERPGAEPLRQVTRAPDDGTRPTVSFRVPLESPGRVPLTVSVSPMEGDARPDNDRRTAVVQVADDKAKVLLVDGEARWEFRYLRNALARDPRVSLEAVLFQQPRPGLTAEPVFTYATTLPQAADPTEADPLGAFDAILLGDVSAEDFPDESWARLDRFVSGRGGTLVLNPGPRGSTGLAATETSRALAPVVDLRALPVEPGAGDPAHPALPPGTPFLPTAEALADASAWPMLQLGADVEESRQRWEGLPPLPWSIGGRAKPGATVLATAGGDPSATLLAVQPYGLGKVLWVGTDGTWRWRHRVGDAYHHRFWGQIVRWAAAGRLASGNALVRFGPLKPTAAEREPIRLQARISEGVPGVGPETLLAARVFRADLSASAEAVTVVPLRSVPGRPRTFEGVGPGLPVGSYVIRLEAPGLTGALGLEPNAEGKVPEAALEVVGRDGPERVELAAARDALDRLASATGGRVLADHEAAALPESLRARNRPRERTEETPLWDSPGALLLFLAVMTVEWVARKRAGLP
ncbi:MAG: hypothetical protein AB7I30_11625 [Isosphaeraceae bacterium]